MKAIDIDTPHGTARAHLRLRRDARGALILGHGAGGGIAARDLVAAADAAGSAGLSAALVEQPYRVAGRRSPAPARQLDIVWTAVVDALKRGDLAELPVVVGGRSAGARVACRTAEITGAVGVLCLAFPLQPPRRAGATPAPSRIGELDGVMVPTLVVQGERDPFGIPPPAPLRTVVLVAGDHGLKADLSRIEAAAQAWLSGLLEQTAAEVRREDGRGAPPRR